MEVLYKFEYLLFLRINLHITLRCFSHDVENMIILFGCEIVSKERFFPYCSLADHDPARWSAATGRRGVCFIAGCVRTFEMGCFNEAAPRPSGAAATMLLPRPWSAGRPSAPPRAACTFASGRPCNEPAAVAWKSPSGRRIGRRTADSCAS